jgi:hypothetical protein
MPMTAMIFRDPQVRGKIASSFDFVRTSKVAENDRSRRRTFTSPGVGQPDVLISRSMVV